MTYGAGEKSRTPDLRITNALLYQLSYAGVAFGRPEACSRAAHSSRAGSPPTLRQPSTVRREPLQRVESSPRRRSVPAATGTAGETALRSRARRPQPGDGPGSAARSDRAIRRASAPARQAPRRSPSGARSSQSLSSACPSSALAARASRRRSNGAWNASSGAPAVQVSNAARAACGSSPWRCAPTPIPCSRMFCLSTPASGWRSTASKLSPIAMARHRTGARVRPVERYPRDGDQSVARRIEAARFDVDHDPAVAGRVVGCGGPSEQPTEPPAQRHRR